MIVTASRLGIIADDLTGAMDSSGYFASLGFTTLVMLDQASSVDATVLVISTNSRAQAPRIASRRVRQAIKHMMGRVIYKKIDSTLRGNIGEELQVAVRETASQKVVVAPAFPKVGRTMVDGVLLVAGIPVAETQFANDPVSPVKESSVCTLLEQSMGVRVGRVSLAEIDAGPENLRNTISNRPERIVVCDTVEQTHLSRIAQAAMLVGESWLLCGSGGLARELHLFLTDVSTIEEKQGGKEIIGPALAMIGTRNQVTANQLVKAREMLGIPIMNLEVDRLSVRNTHSGRLSLSRDINRLIGQRKGLVISSTFSKYVPTLRENLAGIMAEIAGGILESHKFAGLFLSGGDTAIGACRQLHVPAILVHGEIEPGLPAGEVYGGHYSGMRMVTKAGGFGTEEAIAKSIEYLERGKLT
jgi:uncharacterized protein YgbK (DUF1537 family)